MYGGFLNHIATHVGFQNIQNLIIGSDQEPSIRKSIREVFPKATNILCTRHLKQNFDLNLERKYNVVKSTRIELINKVFGKSGLCNADDLVKFDVRQ